MLKIGKFYLINFVFIFLYSCSIFDSENNSHWVERRIERLSKKYNVYTIGKKTDTIYIHSVKYDTINTLIKNDSVIVFNNDKVTVKYFYDTVTNNIFHKTFIKPDTIYKERPEISINTGDVEVFGFTESEIKKIVYWFLGLSFIFFSLLILFEYLKRKFTGK